jgi:ubiquinone biosynthesis protein Coq4
LLADQGLEPLPPPQIPAAADGDDAYLHSRIRSCHDVWHAICGCPTSLAGEAALNGVSAEQLRWPGSALLLAADLIHRAQEPLQAEGVDVGRAIAFGLELGCLAPPLLAQRWEEGWQLPLAAWREALGISALISRSPFAAPS